VDGGELEGLGSATSAKQNVKRWMDEAVEIRFGEEEK